ncbi:hypothetical protein [Paraconexibacter sp.]|uniref:hypothetical protein n=1 Tax=Paraconexibacter sp. TaxID=2949640 RepID=UPI003564DB4A
MNGSAPRARTPISRTKLALLRPILRYSQGRDAYVLRAIGNHRGPVFKAERRRITGL